MRIEELIRRLSDIRQEFGNLEVHANHEFIDEDYGCLADEWIPIEEIYVKNKVLRID